MFFAPIEEVKIYRTGAVVRRKTSVSLKEGTNEIIISGLSNLADPDSLRLFFSAGIIGKDVQIIPFAEAVERLPSADINEEIIELQSKIQTLKKVEALWISNGNFESRGECSNETIESYLKELPSNLENLRANQREIDKQLKALTEKKEQHEIKEAFQVIKLVLESPEDCNANCEIEYFEKSVQWKSTYEIHAVADSAAINVVSRARITQTTGEDWENVRVFLFTGNPTVQQKIPALKKMELSFKPVFKGIPLPMRAPGNAMRSGMGETAVLNQSACDSVPVSPGQTEELFRDAAEEADAETMTMYRLPGRYTIPSETLGSMVDLKTVSIPAEMRIVCIPKLDNNAYLAALIKTENWSLKPSSAKIYLNSNYCGEIHIAPNPATEEVFMLSLGKDERISLNYEEIRNKTENVFFKGQKRRISEYAIRISNKSNKPCTVLVWDQIPISSEKQIVVDNIEVDGASVDKETGKLNWSLSIEAKTTVEKHLSYIVTYPKDKILHENFTQTVSRLKICPRCGSYAEGAFCPKCGSRLE